MKLAVTTILLAGVLALAGPASAQLVNGIAGPNYHGDAPIGTKAGGSPSSLKAPGELAAIAGARRNEMEANGLGMKTAFRPMKAAAIRRQAMTRRTIARNEYLEARARLQKNSD